MSQVQLLAGRRVVVTRPAGQAGALMAKLAAAGATPIALPVIDIAPADAATLRAAADVTLAADRAIFVSPTAIELLWPHLAGRLGARPALATVGAASARRLGELSQRPVLHPQGRSDADALAALPELAAPLHGQRIALVKGSGGRSPRLAAQLSERGAEVTMLDVYRRQPASPDWHHVDAGRPRRGCRGADQLGSGGLVIHAGWRVAPGNVTILALRGASPAHCPAPGRMRRLALSDYRSG